MTAAAPSHSTSTGSSAVASRAVAGDALPMLLVRTLGSMKLAVWLLLILAALTWLGTLAQIGQGLWRVQREYFESWGLIAELPLSWWGEPLFAGADGQGFVLKIPLPGAYPVMGLLFVNLIVGGLLRLRWTLRNTGVLIVHVGIALLLLAGFVKLEYSYSGHLALYESPGDGGQVAQRVHESSTFVSFHDYELALLRDDGETITERVVPEAALLPAHEGVVTLGAPDLPFTVQVHHWQDNCRPLPKGPMFTSPTPVIDQGDGGPGVFLQPEKPNKQREANTAGCYVTVVVDGGKRIEGILHGAELRPFDGRRFPFTFAVDGRRYGLDLRRVVYDLPFAVRLDRFVKRDHPGTATPADFRSFVTVKEDGRERAAQIYMNTPLRKSGFVLYQTNWGPQQGGGPPWYSVFEVADNPSDVWPAVACGVIAIGLLLHFVMKLWRFLGSSTRQALSS